METRTPEVSDSGSVTDIATWLRRPQTLWVLYLLGLVVLVLLLRREAILTKDVFNPDESELLADGIRASMSWVPFRDFTSPTFGPIWPLMLGLLHRVGLPLTLPVAHFLSAAMIAAICVLVAILVGRNVGRRIGVALSLPLALQFGSGLGEWDFLSMSTELLPVLFLTAGCVLAFTKRLSYRRAFLAAILFGLAVFSKYFFAPVAFVGLLAVLVRLLAAGRKPIRSLAIVFGGAICVYAVLVLVAIGLGEPRWKIFESLRITWEYSRGGGLATKDPLTLNQKISLLGQEAVRQISVLLIAITALLFAAVRPRGLPRPLAKSWRDLRDVAWSDILRLGTVAAVVSGFGLLLLSGPNFPHYWYLALAGSIVALGCGSSVFASLGGFDSVSCGQSIRRVLTACIGLLCIPLILGSVAPVNGSVVDGAKTSLAALFTSSGAQWERAWTKDGRPLSDFCPAGSRVLVWGWHPMLYSFYDWIPASRYVVTSGMISDNDVNIEPHWLRRRLSNDVVADDVDCVIDAGGPAFFGGYTDRANMKEQMPDLWSHLGGSMDQVTFYWDRVGPFQVLTRPGASS